jgi:SGNH domain (fused to AT3 domains)
MLGRGDYFDVADAERRAIDFQDPRRVDAILAKLSEELARLTSIGKEVYVVLNPPGGARADPGMVAGSRLSRDGILEVKSIPISEHLRRTAAINERVKAMALVAGSTVIDPAAWICANGKCALTDQFGIPYFKDTTHFRASFVSCCVRDFDALVLTNN